MTDLMMIALPSPSPPWADLRVGTLERGIVRLRKLGSGFVTGIPAAGVGIVVQLLLVLAGRFAQLRVRRYSHKRYTQRGLALAAGRLIYAAAIVPVVLVACVISFPNFTPTSMLSLGLGSLVLPARGVGEARTDG